MLADSDVIILCGFAVFRPDDIFDDNFSAYRFVPSLILLP